jgi:hypothetical protein
VLPRKNPFGPEAVQTGPQETNSPVFASLIEAMGKKAHQNQVILDLGPARAANLELLSRFRCKLFMENAPELVEHLTGDSKADKAAMEQWLAQWTAGSGGESIDVVLAWDVLNYFKPELFTSFINHVTPLLRAGAYLYFLVYSQKQMPALPMQFKTAAPDRLACQPLTAETRPSPRYTQTDLRRRLPGYSVVKSVLLRNGIQEYLLNRTA